MHRCDVDESATLTTGGSSPTKGTRVSSRTARLTALVRSRLRTRPTDGRVKKVRRARAASSPFCHRAICSPARAPEHSQSHACIHTHTDNASAVRDTLPAVGTFQNRMLKTGGKQQAAVNLAKEAEASAVEKANKARELKA
jgi:hypothetical protein